MSDSDALMSSIWPFIPFKFNIFNFLISKSNKVLSNQDMFDIKHRNHPSCIDSGLWDQLRTDGIDTTTYLNSEIRNIIGSSIFEFVNTAYDKNGELKYPTFVKRYSEQNPLLFNRSKYKNETDYLNKPLPTDKDLPILPVDKELPNPIQTMIEDWFNNSSDILPGISKKEFLNLSNNKEFIQELGNRLMNNQNLYSLISDNIQSSFIGTFIIPTLTFSKFKLLILLVKFLVCLIIFIYFYLSNYFEYSHLSDYSVLQAGYIPTFITKFSFRVLLPKPSFKSLNFTHRNRFVFDDDAESVLTGKTNWGV
jgi:hypothetical protein